LAAQVEGGRIICGNRLRLEPLSLLLNNSLGVVVVVVVWSILKLISLLSRRWGLLETSEVETRRCRLLPSWLLLLLHRICGHLRSETCLTDSTRVDCKSGLLHPGWAHSTIVSCCELRPWLLHLKLIALVAIL